MIKKATDRDDWSGKTNDQIVNDVIDYLFKNPGWAYISQIYNTHKMDDQRADLIDSLIIETGIVEYQNPSIQYWFKLSPQGRILINKHGSFNQYLISIMNETELMNLVLNQLNTKEVNHCHDFQELLDATKLDENTLEVICKKLHKLGDCDYHRQCTSITDDGKYKANRGGYKEPEKIPIAPIHIERIGDDFTSHGDNSPINKGGTQTQNITPTKEPVKEKWWKKILDEFTKNATNYIIAAVIGYAGGLINGKACNQHSSPQETKKDTIKNVRVPQK